MADFAARREVSARSWCGARHGLNVLTGPLPIWCMSIASMTRSRHIVGGEVPGDTRRGRN